MKMNITIIINFIPFILLIFFKLFYSLSCIAFILPFAVFFMIFKLEFEYRNYKRICFANCFFKKESFVYRLFTKRLFNFVISFLVLVILVVVLFFSFIFFNWWEILILGFDIFLLNYIYQKISLNMLNEDIKKVFVINFASFFNGVFLFLLFLIINLLLPLPSFVDNDLLATINNYSKEFFSSCEVLNYILKLFADFYAFEYWLFAKLFISSDNEWWRVLLAIILLGGNFFVFYAFGKYILIMKEVINEQLK